MYSAVIIHVLPLSRCITDLYAETMQLKAINPDIKVLLSVGGWLHGTAPFTDMVGNIIYTCMYVGLMGHPILKFVRSGCSWLCECEIKFNDKIWLLDC